MLRAVAGAVRNTAHAHQVELPWNFDRSVAKRAAGTLSAREAVASPEELAGVVSRQKGAGDNDSSPGLNGSHSVKDRKKGGHLKQLRWSPLFRVWKEITRKMWSITDPVAREAYIDVLRMLAKEQEKLK